MKFLLMLFVFTTVSYAANEKAEYSKERYFPSSWEPPTVTNVGGGIVSISPSAPNFDSAKKLGSYIEIGNTSIKRSDTVKVIFSMIVKGVRKRIYIGKIFRINNHPYKFIGAEDDSYIIEDMKTKKKIIFTKKPKKKEAK
jgi:hypothetical protein